MKKLFYNGLIMLGIVTLTFSACKKNNDLSDSQDITSAEESAQADETFSDTFTDISTMSAESAGLFIAGGTRIQSSGTPAISGSCVNITVTTPQGAVWPKTVTFDFGAGCTANDVTRKGKIIAVFTDRFKNEGSRVTITFDNYYVNSTKIEGTKTITNNGKNAAGNYTFTLDISKVRINNTHGTFTWNSTKTIEWNKGENTSVVSDDEFSITGSASGTNTKGQAFTVTITKPLIKKIACRFIVSGIVEIKTGDRPVRALDYGNGDCDAKATVIVNDIKHEITLRK